MADSIGPEKAKVFADYYEQLMNSNPGDRAMDLYNNQVGRSLVDNRVDNTGKVGDTTKGAIDDLVRAGRLRTRPY